MALAPLSRGSELQDTFGRSSQTARQMDRQSRCRAHLSAGQEIRSPAGDGLTNRRVVFRGHPPVGLWRIGNSAAGRQESRVSWKSPVEGARIKRRPALRTVSATRAQHVGRRLVRVVRDSFLATGNDLVQRRRRPPLVRRPGRESGRRPLEGIGLPRGSANFPITLFRFPRGERVLVLHGFVTFHGVMVPDSDSLIVPS